VAKRSTRNRRGRASPRRRHRKVTRKQRAEAVLGLVIASAAVGVLCLYNRNYPAAFWMPLYSISLAAYITHTTFPTRCNVLTERLRPCTRAIRGVLFGCHDHTWERFWSMLGVRRSRVVREFGPAEVGNDEQFDHIALRNGVLEERRNAILYRFTIAGVLIAFVSMTTDLIGLFR
jgi:hypothetical protein